VLGDALRHVLQIIEKYEGHEYGTRRYEYGTRNYSTWHFAYFVIKGASVKECDLLSEHSCTVRLAS
jgi:hypothetical protein